MSGHCEGVRVRDWSRAVGQVLVLGVAAATALGFPFARDHQNGRAEASDGLPLAAAFLLLGLFTDRLPALWRASRRLWFEPVVTQVYMATALGYLYFVFKTGFMQPGATAVAVSAQVFVVASLSLRAS